MRAGYSKKSAEVIGSKLLSKFKVEIKKEIEEFAKEADIEAARIIYELKLIAFSDIKDYMDIDPDTGGVRCKGFGDMPEDASRAIQSIREDRSITEDSRGEQSIIYSKFKFKLHDKLRALEALGKYKNLFAENVNVTGKIDGKLIVEFISKPKKKGKG